MGIAALLVSFAGAAWGRSEAEERTGVRAKATKWFNHYKYLKGLSIHPHSSVDIVEFYLQYQKNQPLWDAAFAFLKSNNLDSIKTGRYPILGDDVYANVSTADTYPIEKTKWEFHRKYIDLQYVYSGLEVMGVAPLDSIRVASRYSESWDGGTGTYNGGRYYTMDFTSFQLFFPSDAHRPGIAVGGPKRVKKVVIKIRYR